MINSLRAGSHSDAVTYFRKLIRIDPEDGLALLGLAETLTLDGRHAASIPWYRRASERRPRSEAIRQALAEALLRREHWEEGRRLIKQPEDPSGLSPPKWDGTPFDEGCLLAYHRPGDPVELTIIGLGFVAGLAQQGCRIVSECPSALAESAAGKLQNVEILEIGSGQTALRLKKGDIFARAALAELPLLLGREPGFLPHWLAAGPTDDTGDGSLAVGVVGIFSKTGDDRDTPLTGELAAELEGLLGVVIMSIDGEDDIGAIIHAFLKTDLIVTDDSAAALLASATGIPVILLLPDAPAPWWWGDRAGGVAPRHCRLRLLHRRYGDKAEETASRIAGIILRGMAAPFTYPHARPIGENQELAEALDIMFPRSETLKVEELKGGTRNKVFRISLPDGDRVLRLGRFPHPSPREHAREIANMTVAAGMGLAPSLYFADDLDGAMLSRFIDGKPMNTKSMRQMENAVAAARLFRKLHTLPLFQGRYDIFPKIEQKAERLTKAESKHFTEQDKINKLIGHIRAILAANGVPACPTHNDPLSKNFIAMGDDLILLDWECSAMGDPHWEVAMLSSQVGMKGNVRDAYLAEYFGAKDHPALSRIPLFEAVCRYYWWAGYLCEDLDRPDQASLRKADDWLGWFNDVVNGESFAESVKATENYRWRQEDGVV